jgi:serine/threonine-protein kinase
MHTPTASVQRVDPAPASGPALERGACLGTYELVLPIASGGMGRVWIAAKRGDFGFSRMFAVKVMREELAMSPSFRRMFLDEAKLAARLRHTNVVEVLDLGESAGTVYQAMELVDGDSLSGLVALAEARSGTRRVAPEIAGRVLSDVLRGLHAAHQLADENGRPLGLVHRDVSAQNILVGLDGVAKLADFGVAKATGSLDADDDSPVGKRPYMAPEQLMGKPVDRRSDVFAAGVVLWELLTGERSRSIGHQLLAGHAIPIPRSLDGTVDPGLSAIAMKALARDASERYATADAMGDAIEEAALRAGLALSAKRVDAWVRDLVGARVSQQREEARREFELSHVVARSPADTEKDPPPRRSWLVPAVVALAAITLLGVGALRFLHTAAASAPASTSAAPPPVAPPTVASESLEPSPAPVVAAEPSTARAPAPMPTTSVRRGMGRASVKPPSTPPNLPYDNPYKR